MAISCAPARSGEALDTIDKRAVEELQALCTKHGGAEAPSTQALQQPPVTAAPSVTVAAIPPPAHTPIQFDWIAAYRQLRELTHRFLEARWDRVHADFRTAANRVSRSVMHRFGQLRGVTELRLPPPRGAIRAEQAYRAMQDMFRRAEESDNAAQAYEIRQTLETINQTATQELERRTIKYGALDALSTRATQTMQETRAMQAIQARQIMQAIQARQTMQATQVRQAMQAIQARQTMQATQVRQAMQAMRARQTMQARQARQTMQARQASQIMQAMYPTQAMRAMYPSQAMRPMYPTQAMRPMYPTQAMQAMYPTQAMRAMQAVQRPPATAGSSVIVASTAVPPPEPVGYPRHRRTPSSWLSIPRSHYRPADSCKRRMSPVRPRRPASPGLPSPKPPARKSATSGAGGSTRPPPPPAPRPRIRLPPRPSSRPRSARSPRSGCNRSTRRRPRPLRLRERAGAGAGAPPTGADPWRIRPPGMSGEPHPVAFDTWSAPPGPGSRVVYTEAIRTPVMSAGAPPGGQRAETPGFARAASGAVELPFSHREAIARRFSTEGALLDAELTVQLGGADALGWSDTRARTVLDDLRRLTAIARVDLAGAAAMADVDWRAIEALGRILDDPPPSP